MILEVLNQKIKFMSIKWWFPGAEGVGKMGEKLVKGGKLFVIR